jgi:hypothetical protein
MSKSIQSTDLAAVTIFQTNYKYAKLTANGQVGNYTWGALFYPSGQRNANQVAV